MNTKLWVMIPGSLEMAYPMMIGADVYDVASWLPHVRFNQIVIITDHQVKKRYGLTLQSCLKKTVQDVLLCSFPAGEKHKSHKTKQNIENTMLAQRCDKDTLIIALGGGVVGDIAGFVAATYFRGLAYVHIPTTLLAMVDSSVGGKTAINTPYGKNLIGAMHHPVCVVADVSLLRSLSKKQRVNGFIEALKMFLTHDAKSFYHSEAHIDAILKGDESMLKDLVSRSVKIKASVVERDEKELGERGLLNFGHTIGHALEKISNYTLLHGYAVAYGILVEASLAHLLGLLNSEAWSAIKQVMSRLGIHGQDLKQYDGEELILATQHDKKVRGADVHYVLLKGVGLTHVVEGKYVHSISNDKVRLALANAIKG